MSDATTFAIKPKYPETAPGKPLRSYLGTPLLFGDKLIGVFVVTSDKTAAFTEQDRDILERLARWLAISINNAVAHKKLSEYGRYLQDIIDLSDEGILVSAQNGTVLLQNESARRLVGLEKEELAEKSVKNLYTGGSEEAHRIFFENSKESLAV